MGSREWTVPTASSDLETFLQQTLRDGFMEKKFQALEKELHSFESDDGSKERCCSLLNEMGKIRLKQGKVREARTLQERCFELTQQTDSNHERLEPIHRLLRPCPDDALVAEPIDTRINRPANEGPDCLRPANSTTSGGDGLLFD